MTLVLQNAEGATAPGSGASVVMWVLTLIGAVAAIQQLWKWATGRKAERGLNKLLETLADQADADEVRQEVNQLRVTLEELPHTLGTTRRQMALDVEDEWRAPFRAHPGR